jgi:small subunit ribosomal protein S1
VPQVDTLPQDAVAVPPAPPPDLFIEVDGKLIPNYDATLVSFEEGDVVTGKVVRIDKDEVLVDIGYKSEGVIPQGELSIRRSIDPAEEVQLGEEVDALVLTKEDQDGRLILSKKRARFERAWRRIETAAESGEPVEGNVIEVVKGGLIIDLGVRGFLPASLVDIRRVQNLDEYLGQKIETKVIELNRSRNNVVLSRRAVLEEERKEARQQILDRLERGMVVEGTISNIVDFGAFVDLDGIDGLIHISELSWGHVNHPSEVLSIGDTVRVKVLDIDRDRQRISLGLKQTQEDPWERVVNTYNVGDVLEGKVTKVVSFGAFVEIMEGVEGLVHISELAQHHVENPREIVDPGDEVKVKILEIDDERRRLSLSLKRVEGQVLPMREIASTGEGEAGDELSDDVGEVPDLDLSEEVFSGDEVSGQATADAPEAPAQEPEVPAGAPEAPQEPEASADQTAAPQEPEASAEPETPAEPEGAAEPAAEDGADQAPRSTEQPEQPEPS